MAGSGRFSIDLTDLDAVVADVEQTETALQELTDDVERQMAALQSVWEGLAADAQKAAQDEWDAGLRAMREALADLRAAARQAHGNYTAGAEANVSMWESVS